MSEGKYVCSTCGTDAMGDKTGIGPYCPNMDCPDTPDGPQIVKKDWRQEKINTYIKDKLNPAEEQIKYAKELFKPERAYWEKEITKLKVENESLLEHHKKEIIEMKMIIGSSWLKIDQLEEENKRLRTENKRLNTIWLKKDFT